MLGYALTAIAVAILAGTGVGGGGLFVLYLAAICSYPQPKAQAVNLVFFIFAAAASLIYHLRHRRISPSAIAFCTLFAVGGTLIGTAIRNLLPENVLRIVFGIFLVAVGTRTLFAKEKSPENRGT